jgi:hypothetical protein
MTRADGFSIADIDVGFLRDLKVRWLRQYIPDDAAATTIVYIAVVLSSWEEGFRLSIAEADSPEDATPERIAALQTAELLDADGRIPLRAWESWFRPAWERRNEKRKGGIEGNRRRWHPDRLSDTDSDTHSDSVSPSRPSVPSYPSVTPSRVIPRDTDTVTTGNALPVERPDVTRDDDDVSSEAYAKGPVNCAKCGAVILGASLRTGAGPMHQGGCPASMRVTP